MRSQEHSCLYRVSYAGSERREERLRSYTMSVAMLLIQDMIEMTISHPSAEP
jgi:hypothetical protein